MYELELLYYPILICLKFLIKAHLKAIVASDLNLAARAVVACEFRGLCGGHSALKLAI